MKVELSIIVDKERVFELLDCKKESDSYDIYEASYEAMLKIAYSAVKPTGYYKFIKNNWNIGIIKESSEIIICLVTLGEQIDIEIKRLFDEFDYLGAMLLSGIADQILFNISNEFYSSIKSQAGKLSFNLSRRVYPNSCDMHGSYLKKIVDGLKKEMDIEFYISEGYMLAPSKSMGYIYGAGVSLPDSLVDHDCANCDSVKCDHRM